MNETVKVYVSGPMRGIKDYNFPAFLRAGEVLKAHGFEVWNPAAEDLKDPAIVEYLKTCGPSWDYADGVTFKDFMKRDLPALLECDAIVMLPGWYNSRGAKLERHVAIEVDMPEYFLTGPDVGPTNMRWDEYVLFKMGGPSGSQIIEETTIELPN